MDIKVPIFRMLGSDPIYQYDNGLDVSSAKGAAEIQSVVSLEPVYKYGGGSPDWVRWYFKENFNKNTLSFGYTQVGQENSFGWAQMKKGFIDQCELLERKVKNNEIRVETLADSGIWYRSEYDITPASLISALSDSSDNGNKTIWYCSRYYRTNIMQQYDKVWIRERYLFDQKYEDRYINKPCTGKLLTYDNLPALDGNLWSGNNIRAGIYPMSIKSDEVKMISFSNIKLNVINENTISIKWDIDNDNEFEIVCCENRIMVNCSLANDMWLLEMKYNLCEDLVRVQGETLSFVHNDFEYSIKASQCSISHIIDENVIRFIPNGNTLIFLLKDERML